MRPALLLTLLLSTACAAQAQQSPNWVDPPAKSSAPAAERAKPAPAAPRSEAPSVEAAETRRASVPTRRSARRQERVHGRTAERPTTGIASRGRRAAIRERARAQAARSPRPPAAAVAAAPAPSLARGEPDLRFTDWAVAAQRLSLDYLASFSAPNGAMLASAPRFYGSQVRFHGRNLSMTALMSEKRRFARRWPERRYEPQGEPRVACDGASASCLVRTVYDFTATSPGRGARSQGVAELLLTVSFAGGRPVVIAESSRVLSRGGSGGV